MTVDYRALVQDGASGAVLGELPLTFDSPIQYRMGDVGQYDAHFPVDHPTATHAMVEDGLREITVLRDDAPIANGPFNWAVDSASRLVNLTVFEASALFDVMVVESLIATTGTEDGFNFIRDIWTALTTQTSTAGDGTASPGLTINAGWPNFTVSAGTSGYTLNTAIAAADFVSFRDVLNKLSQNAVIEWRIDYSALSGSRGCARELVLGAPLGSTSTRTLTEFNLASYGRTGNVLGSGTRVHLRGSGITSTKQNTGSITAGWPLMGQVKDRSDLTDQTLLDDAAKEFRRQVQPPIKIRSASYTPGPMLPFGAFSLGDTVPIAVNDPAPLLDINVSNLRVVGIDVTVPSGTNPELVTLTFDLPLSATGA